METGFCCRGKWLAVSHKMQGVWEHLALQAGFYSVYLVRYFLNAGSPFKPTSCTWTTIVRAGKRYIVEQLHDRQWGDDWCKLVPTALALFLLALLRHYRYRPAVKQTTSTSFWILAAALLQCYCTTPLQNFCRWNILAEYLLGMPETQSCFARGKSGRSHVQTAINFKEKYSVPCKLSYVHSNKTGNARVT